MANICIFSFFFVKIITKLTGSPFRGEESKLWHSDNNDKHAGLCLHPANNEGRLYSLKSCSTVYGHATLNVPDLIGNHTVWKTYIHSSSIFKLSYFSSFFPQYYDHMIFIYFNLFISFKTLFILCYANTCQLLISHNMISHKFLGKDCGLAVN